MAADNIKGRHTKELADFKEQRKKAWSELLKGQDDRLMESDDPKLVYRFAQEREDHNKRYKKEEAELFKKHWDELQEYKKGKSRDRSKDEKEM
ncbi:hypothetical protein [Niabella hibiscisoli]|uniref:hypothetical protein n=1 Tax=Niabella hibiscisoli TaxID=1825928 RepID=UPI001F116117|nr:hypothetical protein [Niabella hibiscisoli]MCH5716710.1 hypothetical protein [Niabella hibiscisoli]